METVEVVVRIPKKCKEFLDNGGKVDWLDAIPIIDAIANGTVLPKKHGRLIDTDSMKRIDAIQRGNFNSIESIRAWIDIIPTVVEADREVENEDSN